LAIPQYADERPISPKAMLSAFVAWCRIIGFLTVQEFGDKFKGSRFDTLMVFAEPFIFIALLCAIKGVFRDNMPGFGTSIFVFFSSGIFPFYLFKRVSVRTKGLPYDASRRFPRVNGSDVAVASAIAEATTMLSTMVIWFSFMWFVLGISDAVPSSLLDCAAPIFFLFVMGVGIGLLNAAMHRRFSLWPFIYGKMTYHLPFLSGVMSVVDVMPMNFRTVVLVNPLTHALEWFRVGLYGHYPHATLDKEYFISCALFALMIGSLAHVATIRLERK
jgi:capsular polysaccharide transport system permease protein